MNYKKLFVTAVLALAMAFNVHAQSSYSYVEVQGGGQFTSTNADITKLLTPTFGLSAGHYFTPYLGARLHFNGYESKGRFESLDADYKWRYLKTDADLLVNLSQALCPGEHFLDVIFLAGAGLNYAWDNDELEKLIVTNTQAKAPLAWSDNRLMHNIRAGLRFETNTSKAIGFSLELTANNTSDRFNSKTNDRDDWQMQAMLGLSYRFGRKTAKKEEPVVVPPPVVVEEPQPVVPVVPEKKLVKKTIKEEQPVSIHKEIFYEICGSDPTQQGLNDLKEVADFTNKYQKVTVTLTGYADRNTGNPEINMSYSQQRSEKAKGLIVERGGKGELIVATSKGDTVQPFEENDKNRCVIIDGRGVNTVEKTIEVEE